MSALATETLVPPRAGAPGSPLTLNAPRVESQLTKKNRETPIASSKTDGVFPPVRLEIGSWYQVLNIEVLFSGASSASDLQAVDDAFRDWWTYGEIKIAWEGVAEDARVVTRADGSQVALTDNESLVSFLDLK